MTMLLLPLLFLSAHARLIMVAIFSRPDNYAKRQLIRSTWAKPMEASSGEDLQIKPMFIMGHSPNEAMQRQVMHERGERGDLVLLPYDDTPGNRAKKLRDAMELAFNSFNASFLLKTTDEIVLNVEQVEATIRKQLRGDSWETPFYLSVIEPSLLRRIQDQYEAEVLYEKLRMTAPLNDVYLVSASIGQWILRQPNVTPASLPEWIDPADDGALMRWWVREFDEQVTGSIWSIDPRVSTGCQAKRGEEWLVRKELADQQANCLWTAESDLSIQAACCSV